MALAPAYRSDIITGYSQDGFVFLRVKDQKLSDGRTATVVIQMEPDYANRIAKRIIAASEKAQFACKRPLVLGDEITIKR